MDVSHGTSATTRTNERVAGHGHAGEADTATCLLLEGEVLGDSLSWHVRTNTYENGCTLLAFALGLSGYTPGAAVECVLA
jgi:hypothetical protein